MSVTMLQARRRGTRELQATCRGTRELQATRRGTRESQDKRARKDKAPKTPTVHMRDQHSSPEWSGESSDEEASSEAEESWPMSAKSSRQIDLNQYPEARQELQDVETFYTQEQNLRRRGVALKLVTWRKAQIHILSESWSDCACACGHGCNTDKHIGL